MAPESRATCQSPRVTISVDPARELDELAGAQSLVRGSNSGSDEVPTPPEAITPPLVPPIKDLFTKFMKVFMETMQA